MNEDIPELAAQDLKHLEQLERRLQMVRDRTSGVVEGFATGFFLHGDGGVGKSYTVVEELNRIKAHYVIHNCRMTGRGLHNALEKHPSAVHLLEDMDGIGARRASSEVACGGNAPHRHRVRWSGS